MSLPDWVVCPHGEGVREGRTRSFPKSSIGIVRWTSQGIARVWLIGINQEWDIPVAEIEQVDVFETGDKFDRKICNACHRLLSVEHFEPNQRKKHGIVWAPVAKDAAPILINVHPRVVKLNKKRKTDRRREPHSNVPSVRGDQLWA